MVAFCPEHPQWDQNLKFTIYTPKRDDEHPHPFHMRRPPPPRGSDPDPVVCVKVRFRAKVTRGFFSLSTPTPWNLLLPLHCSLSLSQRKISRKFSGTSIFNSKAVVKDNHGQEPPAMGHTSMSSGNFIVHIQVFFFFRLNVSLAKVNHKVMYGVCLAGLFSVEGQQCVSNPCHFNGTCTDIGSSNYSCQCPSGFTGKKSHWCFSWYIVT